MLDTSTSKVPFYNPMLPTITEDSPPHVALLVMGGNDMLKHLDEVKEGSMTPRQFADGMTARLSEIIDRMQEVGFQRVGLIPMKRENVTDIIRSLEIPMKMVDALDVVYQRIAEAYPEFVYVSPHDLYEGLDPQKDYLDSPLNLDVLKAQRWETPVYKKVMDRDKEFGRERVHPNPLGQAKVAKTMTETVRETVLGMESPCLSKEPRYTVSCLEDEGVTRRRANQQDIAI